MGLDQGFKVLVFGNGSFYGLNQMVVWEIGGETF